MWIKEIKGDIEFFQMNTKNELVEKSVNLLTSLKLLIASLNLLETCPNLLATCPTSLNLATPRQNLLATPHRSKSY